MNRECIRDASRILVGCPVGCSGRSQRPAQITQTGVPVRYPPRARASRATCIEAMQVGRCRMQEVVGPPRSSSHSSPNTVRLTPHSEDPDAEFCERGVAALGRHGKSKPPRRRNEKVELVGFFGEGRIAASAISVRVRGWASSGDPSSPLRRRCCRPRVCRRVTGVAVLQCTTVDAGDDRDPTLAFDHELAGC